MEGWVEEEEGEGSANGSNEDFFFFSFFSFCFMQMQLLAWTRVVTAELTRGYIIFGRRQGGEQQAGGGVDIDVNEEEGASDSGIGTRSASALGYGGRLAGRRT